MSDVAPSSDGSTRGFLFADLRSYTHLVDTRGAVEASHLLGRYREIVRRVVADHGGAEIKTEGDSFYVVLPSASEALRCGLAILAACREPADGAMAIDLGVGIHAGESVAHEGGFVGSAVNIAARLCALAGAGELLVSGTIRELTRSIVAARFTYVGRRHLKGLDEPVEVFRVVSDGSAKTGWRGSVEDSSAARRFLLLGVAAIVVAIVGAGAAMAAGWRPNVWVWNEVESASPTASIASSVGEPGGSPSIQLLPEPGLSVDPGAIYRPKRNQDVASITVPGCCWLVLADAADLLSFGNPSQGSGGVGIARITVVYTGGCSDAPTRIIGDRPRDLIDWVQAAPQLDASQPTAVIDLGRSGIGIEATVLAPGACGPSNPTEAYLWGVSGGAWFPEAGDRIIFEALEDGSRTLVVVIAANDAEELSTFEATAGRLLLASLVLR